MNEWKVLSNPVAGEYVYQVYKIKDPTEPMHAGNVLTKGTPFDSEKEAQEYADRINRDTEEKNKVCAALLQALQATRNLSDLVSLEYDDDREIVKAIFTGGRRNINVYADSSFAMIKDIVNHIQ